MALTDVAIRAAKPRAKPYKMGDTLGLYLLVQPSGGKLWRLKYRFAGSEKKLALGVYPQVGLGAARDARDRARKLIAEGVDPSLQKQREKLRAQISAENTFATVAAEYVDKRTREGWAQATGAKADFLLRQLAPGIGRMPIAEIQPTDVLMVLRRIEARGTLETARRTLQFASNVFRYAVATARVPSDPTRDLRGALTAPRTKHHAAITDARRVGELLRAIDGYDGTITTKIALQLAPHVFVRPGELRQAEWAEFDLEAAVWTLPATKMKMRRAHHVPLSEQAIALLRSIREVTGARRYVFPSIRSTTRPMSENTLNAALRRLGYTVGEMTAHGFRSTASTLLNESGKWSPDAIERALAHADSDEVRGAYHRGQHWAERIAMAQWWSDHLDALRKGAEIVPFPAKETA